MESINRNVTPKDPFEGYRPVLFPTLKRCSDAVIHLFTRHHEIPPETVIDLREPVEIPEETRLMLDHLTNEP